MSKWIAVALSIWVCTLAGAQGIEFFHGTFEEAKEVARQSGKLIFVDAFTTWCGPCKRMSKNIFPQEKVGSFYNESFVNLKLDMEKGEGRDFQRKYRVNAFPTFLFIDHNGKTVHRVTGGMDADNFVRLGNLAASKGDVSNTMDKDYEEGNRDPEFMAKYIEARAKAGRPVIQITNDYLRSTSLEGEAKLCILFYATTEVDSRIFTAMIKSKEEMESLFGAEAVSLQIEKAAKNTVKKAMQFANPDLIEEAIDKVNRYAPNQSKHFEYEARLSYYTYVDDAAKYLKYAKAYVKMGNEEKFIVINNIAAKLYGHSNLLKSGVNWAEQLSQSVPSESHCFVAAQLQFLSKDYQNAQKSAELALSFAKENKSNAAPHIEKLIKAIGDKIGSHKT